MKRIVTIIVLALSAATTVLYAQTQKEITKEREEIAKLSKSQLNEKASKAAQKEAKNYEKAGWTVAPGALPIEKQLDKSYMMQMEYDEQMFPKYLMGEGMSIGEIYNSAKMQALELAKQNLAEQIQTEITTLIENQVSNKQLSADDAASVTQSVSAGKSLISQNIGRVITVVELYRTKSNKNTEVLLRIAYNAEMAKEAAKKAIRQDLEQKGDELAKQLDGILGE